MVTPKRPRYDCQWNLTSCAGRELLLRLNVKLQRRIAEQYWGQRPVTQGSLPNTAKEGGRNRGEGRGLLGAVAAPKEVREGDGDQTRARRHDECPPASQSRVLSVSFGKQVEKQHAGNQKEKNNYNKRVKQKARYDAEEFLQKGKNSGYPRTRDAGKSDGKHVHEAFQLVLTPLDYTLDPGQVLKHTQTRTGTERGEKAVVL